MLGLILAEIVFGDLGYRAGQQQCFIDLLHGKKDRYLPTLEDGVRMQKMLDAIMDSAEGNVWVDIK